MLSSIPAIIQSFQQDFAGTLVYLAMSFAAILLSLIIHENAHGYMALWCGDPTAKMRGRLSFDPRKHLDPIGTISMLFLRIGWAKPVPINPRYFRKYRRDYILVSIAGILANLLLFLISLTVMAVIEKYARAMWLIYPYRFFYILAQMNLGLAVFNLLPIPPLDGFRLVDQFLFNGRLSLNRQTMQIVQIVFLVVCLTGVLGKYLGKIDGAIFDGAYSLICRLFGIG